MLTKKELTDLIYLEYRVQEAANHVASIVKEWDPDLGRDEGRVWWDHEFEDEKDLSKGMIIYGSVSSFDAELLCKTDEELHKYVECKKEEHRRWVEAREKEKQLEKERAIQEREEKNEKFSKMSKSELLRYLKVPEELIRQVELEERESEKIEALNEDTPSEIEIQESNNVVFNYRGENTKLVINNTEI